MEAVERIMTNRLDRSFFRYQDEFEEAALRVLRSGRYVLGEELERFEEAFAAYIGTKHAIGVGNGLDALRIACLALDIGPGDEVIVPGNTFIASALAVTQTGATPVFAEPDEFFLLDPAEIEKRCTERTKAVMVVHLYGQTARMDAISEICKKKGLRIIEDCAQAHGAHFMGKTCGSIGDVGCFSFFPTKNLGAFGDGGGITTDDDALAERMRRLRNYGSTVRYHYEECGINSRLDELQAALLAVRLKHMNDLNRERKASAAAYEAGIENTKIEKPKTCLGAEHVYHQYVIRTNERDRLIAHLKIRGIDTLIHYPVPCHLSECYSGLGYAKGSLPVTERYSATVLSIPMYAGLAKKEQARVIEALNEF